ncbi:ArsR/SmtB family transcription factor [Luminiphilus syltensis]|nr:metalloregulator ArsR/SmtB family transcription factor [Luminiphilus syltensis]
MSNVNTVTPLPMRPAAGQKSAVDYPSLFKALGDALRLNILRVLHGDSFSVSELCDVFDLRQSALSHHLKVLVAADLLVRRREGTAIFYRRQVPDGPDKALLQAVYAALDDVALDEELVDSLAKVHHQRELNSLNFFRDHLTQFRENREMIASYSDYADASLHLLDTLALADDASVLEIGPGEGDLLPALAERVTNLTALDNSPAMLDIARTKIDPGLAVTFIEGDIGAGALADQCFDVVVANMVLHHTPHPEKVFAASAAHLKPGGALIISELCAHDQAWAREHCGDLWLGFEPAQLSHWAEGTGLTASAEVFIAQRNGFQIQVRLFRRSESTGDLK